MHYLCQKSYIEVDIWYFQWYVSIRQILIRIRSQKEIMTKKLFAPFFLKKERKWEWMIILFLWPDEKVRTNLFFWSCHVGRYEVKVGLIQLASECHAWSSKVVKIPLNESVLRYYNVLLSLANAFLGRKNKQLTLPECDMTTCFSEMPTIAFSRTYFWNLSAARRVTVVTFWSPFLSDLFFLYQISF